MSNDSPRAISPGLRALGILCLLVAIAASFALALDHFAIVQPPGCGPQSGCDRATRSAWGTIPGLNWPVSLLGVAYFGALLPAWLASSRSLHPMLRALAWLGAAASCLFIAVMLSGGYVCKYCLATHIANLLFVVVMETAARRGKRVDRAVLPVTLGAATFLALTAALAVAHVQTNARRLARDEAALKASIAQIQQATTRGSNDSVATTTTTAPIANAKPFTGRWRLGPENAPIRIVMFTDYQCQDCLGMESQVMAVLRRRKEVSVSIKHFPMSSKCNRHLTVDMHANACWAARAAEAAGMLRGNDGFWQMHHWLFEHRGEFTDANFPPSLQQLGYDPQQFINTMMSPQTLERVQADIEEGADLGLFFTPMIFINGVELRGFINNPNALVRAVDALAATNPPAGLPTQDNPARAVDKYVEDWFSGQVRNAPPRSSPHALGPDNASVQIVMWSDYQQPLTAELDRLIGEHMAATGERDGGIRYEFRHYPFDQSCNGGVKETALPYGCLAARAAEAAGALGGNDAYWKMHRWLLSHQVALSDALLRDAAQAAGVDPDALLAKLNDPAVTAIVNEDVQTGRGFVMQGIPTLYVNGRWVPRWKLEGEEILARIVQRAMAGP